LWERSLELLHPGMLDGALQLLAECGTRKSGSSLPAYLPFTVHRAIVAAACPAGPFWAGVRLAHCSARAVSGDVEVFGAGGRLAVRLQGVTCVRADKPKSVAAAPPDVAAQAGVDPEHCLYSVDWTSQIPPVASSGRGRPTPSRERALLCVPEGAREAVQTALALAAESCVFVGTVAEAISAAEEEDQQWATVVFQASGSQLDALDDALRLLQVLASFGREAPALVFVTTGMQAPELNASEHDPTHAGITQEY
jgi:hypothetical protein